MCLRAICNNDKLRLGVFALKIVTCLSIMLYQELSGSLSNTKFHVNDISQTEIKETVSVLKKTLVLSIRFKYNSIKTYSWNHLFMTKTRLTYLRNSNPILFAGKVNLFYLQGNEIYFTLSVNQKSILLSI